MLPNLHFKEEQMATTPTTDTEKLATALASGTPLPQAAAANGSGVTAGEYIALQQLHPNELQALAATQAKLNAIRAGAADDAWVCVNGVC
jgi:hypothetical protein